jgi:copper chaperone CopZ
LWSFYRPLTAPLSPLEVPARLDGAAVIPGIPLSETVLLSQFNCTDPSLVKRASINISGMHCQSCVERVRTALQGLPAVVITKVEVGSLEVDFDESKANISSVLGAIRSVEGLDVTAFRTAPME